MSEETELRQHAEHDRQASKYPEIADPKINKSYVVHNSCIGDLRNISVLTAHGPIKATSPDVVRCQYELCRFGASRKHCNECHETNSIQVKYYKPLMKNNNPKTDKEVKAIITDVDVKHLQKIKHSTLSINETDSLKLLRNTFKNVSDIYIASTDLIFIPDSQTYNFRRLAGNILSSSFSNCSARINEKLIDRYHKNSHLKLPTTKRYSKLKLKSKLNNFQSPEICQKKERDSYEELPIILNLSFGCTACESFNSHVLKNKTNLIEQSWGPSTSSTSLSASTESSTDKRKQLNSRKRDLHLINDKPNENKPVLMYIRSQCIQKPNRNLTQYGDKRTKVTGKQKARRISFNRCRRCFKGKIENDSTNTFPQYYQTYYAELDYNNLALMLAQASRQAVGIGSTCECFIDFGRCTNPDYSVHGGQYGQIDSNVNKNQSQSIRQSYECAPGVCIPGKCEPSECFKRLPFGSHAATQSPSSRAVTRVGSKSSFNVQFYKDTPLDKQNKNRKEQGNVEFGNKNFECQPGVCVPGKCDPKECFTRIKATHGSSHSSQASTQSRKQKGPDASYKAKGGKDKGVSSTVRNKPTLNIPNRQAVRIGSKCSFNVEFYKAMPYGLGGQRADPTYTQPVYNEVTNLSSRQTRKNKTQMRTSKPFECEPGVCIPGKCNPMDCYQRIKADSLSGSSNTTSHGSQGRKSKGQARKGDKATYYKEKGALTKPRPKNQLHIPNRQAVRIGSKCNFNVEFYKSMPHGGNNKVRQKAATRKINNTLKPYECEPGVCIPGRCDPNECFLTLKTRHDGSGYSSNGTSQASNKMFKERTRVMKTGQASFYKDTGASSMRQPRIKLKDAYGPKDGAVRIGSTGSFNIEFYKHTSPNPFGEPVPILPNQMNTELVPGQVPYMPGVPGKPGRKGIRNGKKIKVSKPYECEPGVCIPDQCDPNECFARLKTRLGGSPAGASLVGSSSYDSQATTQTKKGKKADSRQRAGKETLYKDKAASTLARSKMPLHIPNRQVVRIGSKCSFNVEFYKDLSKNGLTDAYGKPIVNKQFLEQYNKMGTPIKPPECEPGVCIPSRCDPKECYQRLTGTPWVQSYASTGSDPGSRGDQLSTGQKTASSQKNKANKIASKPEKKDKSAEQKDKGGERKDNKADKNAEKKDKNAEQKDKNVEQNDKNADKNKKKKPKHGTQSPEDNDQGDSAAQQQTDKKIQSKSNRKRIKPSPEQNDKEFRCDPGVCTPGKCDPNKCFDRLKSRHEGTKTDASLADTGSTTSTSSQASTKASVVTQSKNARSNSGTKNKAVAAGRHKSKIGKEQMAEKDGTSSIASSPLQNTTPLHTPTKLNNKNAVRIGSTCSFNITFFKDTPLSRNNRNLSAVAQRSESLQVKNKKGIVPLVKKCYCLISTKQKSASSKQSTMLYDQGSNTDELMLDPKQKKKGAKTNTALFPSVGPGKQKGLECRLGACIPNKCNPKDCFEREKSSANGTNAATQSRRFPGPQRGKAFLCKCACMDMCHVKENVVVLGSGCSFNFKRYAKKKQQK